MINECDVLPKHLVLAPLTPCDGVNVRSGTSSVKVVRRLRWRSVALKRELEKIFDARRRMQQ
jgi:hypothetical protein